MGIFLFLFETEIRMRHSTEKNQKHKKDMLSKKYHFLFNMSS